MAAVRYACRDGWRLIVRHWGLSLLTVFTAMSVFFIIGASTLFVLNVRNIVSSLENQLTIQAYLKPKADIAAAEKAIKALPYVKETKAITKDMALERLRSRIGEQAKAVMLLGENPLPESIEIKVRKASEVAETARLLVAVPEVEDIVYAGRVAEKLTRVSGFVEKFSIVMLLVAIAASGVVLFNTIRISVYSRAKQYMPKYHHLEAMTSLFKTNSDTSPLMNAAAAPIYHPCGRDSRKRSIPPTSFACMRVAPSIAGIESRNENLKTSSLQIPAAVPAIIVMPERETPGITAIPCAMPTQIPSKVDTLPSPFLIKRLEIRIRPVNTSPSPTIREFVIAASARSFIAMPMAPVTRVPIKTAQPICHPVRSLLSLWKSPETHSPSRPMISLKKKRIVAAIVATWRTRS
jgi:hypothetical protein